MPLGANHPEIALEIAKFSPICETAGISRENRPSAVVPPQTRDSNVMLSTCSRLRYILLGGSGITASKERARTGTGAAIRISSVVVYREAGRRGGALRRPLRVQDKTT